ncbi:hypothetical protein AMECASPLE_033934 [Ameca splendens]|uniref:Ig-like domain-containing protein n=1 Tax=Ameca splendens TaxID=208324 RepID=A0ABV0XVZ1_9TELE
MSSDCFIEDISAPILVSPLHPVTEGDHLTLSCRDKQKLLSNVFFYHNKKLLHNDSRGQLKISAVSTSDEGFYKCKHSEMQSPRSWISIRVTVPSPVSSFFPVLWTFGPVSGIILIILLLLLWFFRRSKDLCSIRSKVSESSSQSSTTNQTESPEYSSLLQGTGDLYETLKFSKAAGNVGHCGPEEGAVYSEVKTGAADFAPTYAVIDHQKNAKKKDKSKGKWSPAAADAAVYSEIRSVPALRDNAAM